MIHWQLDAGQHRARVGPFTLLVCKALDRRDPGKEWDAYVWRNGHTVATSCEHPDLDTAKLQCVDALRKYLADERKTFVQVELALSA